MSNAGDFSQSDARGFGWFKKPATSQDTTPTKPTILPIAPPIHSDKYELNHPNRGIALIFNHTNFKGSRNQRKGSSHDAAAVLKTFSKLGFKTDYNHDLTKNEILMKLNAVARSDHTQSDCLAVVVMTHGDPNEIAASDDSYKVSLLWESFSANKCMTLVGKPKLFFIQACRGEHVDDGVTVAVKDSGPLRTFTAKDAAARVTYTIPTMADILIFNATFDGHYAWRSGEQGSWFIQELCKELDSNAEHMEILQLCVRVNRRVAIQYSSYVPGMANLHNKKQMPNFLTTFTRELYFTSKEIKNLGQLSIGIGCS